MSPKKPQTNTVQGILSLQPFQRGLWFLNFVVTIFDNWELRGKKCFCEEIGISRREFFENLNVKTDKQSENGSDREVYEALLELDNQLGRSVGGSDRRSLKYYNDGGER